MRSKLLKWLAAGVSFTGFHAGNTGSNPVGDANYFS